MILVLLAGGRVIQVLQSYNTTQQHYLLLLPVLNVLRITLAYHLLVL